MFLIGPLVVMGASTWLAWKVLGRTSRELAAVVAVGSFAFQAGVVVILFALLGDPCDGGGPDDREALAIVLGSAALGGSAFGGTLVTTNRHPASAAVAFVGVALPFVLVLRDLRVGC